MSRVFLSHSSYDGLEAAALKQWLVDQEPGLAQEIFLDLDPRTGLAPGERWKEALQRSTARCEAVICLLSAHWEASAECRTEYRTAENLGKLIFCARLEPEATGEVTAQWQRCDLFGAGPVTEIPIEVNGRTRTVAFRTEGLERLLRGLRRAGIGAEHFPWPPSGEPDRAPYRGWEPLEEADAAVFFGRDVPILRGLDALRGMRTTGTTSLFVILGPSGVGKSSFLRAGLLPRLRREDRHFVVLELMRPERAALTGDKGFAAALHGARIRLGLKGPALGVLKAACAAGDTPRVREWLEEVRRAAADRLPDDSAGAPAPTVVLPVDQAEELFSVDAGAEAPRFLELLAELVRTRTGVTPGLIVAETIRADLYEPLQTAPALARVRSVVFDDLKPLPRAQFKDVITGPAERATAAGRPVALEPALVDRLLAETDQGADTLPLLALTLARLYRDYGTTGTLTLEAYTAMGGMARVVQSEIDALLASDPAVRQAQLELLRSAFVPWLATINPDNDQPVRRVARLDDLPVASRPLIEAMVQARLLVQDNRGGVTVIEVALESLLRQWEDLARWLAIERGNLVEADALERAAIAWEDHGRDEAWLILGHRLAAAETLAATPHFTQRLHAMVPFLEASRQYEDDRAAAEQRRQQAELHAAREKAAVELKAREQAQAHAAVLKKRSRVLRMVLAAAVVVAMAAVTGFGFALQARREADIRAREATASRLSAEGQAMLTGDRAGGDVRALHLLSIAHGLAPTTQSQEGLIQGIEARPRLIKVMETQALGASVVFSPQGDRIVSGGGDGAVQMWDAGTGEPLGPPLAGHEGTVLSMAFSPSGDQIVSGDEYGVVRVWDASSGDPLGPPLTGHEDGVASVAFSNGGDRILTGSYDGSVRVWDAGSREPLGQPLTGHEDGVADVTFSPEGDRILTASNDGSVRVWDARSRELIGTPLVGPREGVSSMEFSPGGDRIVFGDDEGTLGVWDLDAGALNSQMPGHEGAVFDVVFDPDGDRIVSSGEDGSVQVWDAGTGDPIGPPLTGHDGIVLSVAFDPDGDRIVSGGGDGSIRVWDAGAGDPIGQPLTGHEEQVFAVAFSSQGDRLASGGYDRTVRMWDVRTREPIGEPLTGHEGGVWDVAFSPGGDRVISGGGDRTVRMWDVRTEEPIGQPLTGHEGGVSGVAFSPDGEEIISGGGDRSVRVWDARTEELIGQPLTGHEGGVSGVAFSPSGDRFISGGYDGTVRVWDARTREPIGEPLTGHDGAVLSVAFSPDGNRLVSGGDDGSVRLWDAHTGESIGAPLTGNEAEVLSVAFSPDGQHVLSGGGDGSVRVWNVHSQEPIGPPLTGHEGSVHSVAFSPDGNLLVSGGDDGTVRMWVEPNSWDDLVCAKLTSNISREQWRRWISPDIEYFEACPGLPERSDAIAE